VGYIEHTGYIDVTACVIRQ